MLDHLTIIRLKMLELCAFDYYDRSSTAEAGYF